ncbi:hypothetical protein R3P38DRAFT_3210667 [Favolaschia claudopus]|uniref:Uncharacterized protein n=1 Tax=Favolaschia claudopus TaxID=2862362 RepID=A0AAW0AHC3_9AGAR
MSRPANPSTWSDPLRVFNVAISLASPTASQHLASCTRNLTFRLDNGNGPAIQKEERLDRPAKLRVRPTSVAVDTVIRNRVSYGQTHTPVSRLDSPFALEVHRVRAVCHLRCEKRNEGDDGLITGFAGLGRTQHQQNVTKSSLIHIIPAFHSFTSIFLILLTHSPPLQPHTHFPNEPRYGPYKYPRHRQLHHLPPTPHFDHLRLFFDVLPSSSIILVFPTSGPRHSHERQAEEDSDSAHAPLVTLLPPCLPRLWTVMPTTSRAGSGVSDAPNREGRTKPSINIVAVRATKLEEVERDREGDGLSAFQLTSVMPRTDPRTMESDVFSTAAPHSRISSDHSEYPSISAPLNVASPSSFSPYISSIPYPPRTSPTSIPTGDIDSSDSPSDNVRTVGSNSPLSFSSSILPSSITAPSSSSTLGCLGVLKITSLTSESSSDAVTSWDRAIRGGQEGRWRWRATTEVREGHIVIMGEV